MGAKGKQSVQTNSKQSSMEDKMKIISLIELLLSFLEITFDNNAELVFLVKIT
jgi:hypothetical protein